MFFIVHSHSPAVTFRLLFGIKVHKNYSRVLAKAVKNTKTSNLHSVQVTDVYFFCMREQINMLLIGSCLLVTLQIHPVWQCFEW